MKRFVTILNKKSAAFAAALLLTCAAPACAGFGFYGGGWGPSWWSAGGSWGPGPGWGMGWGGPSAGWWGPSPYYNYYNGVQDGVGAGLLLGELDRLLGTPAPASTENYQTVLAEINAAAQTMAQKEAQQAAQLVTDSGVGAAISSLESYWRQQTMQTEAVTNGGQSRLGVSGFTQGLKILYIIDQTQSNVTVIVGTSQFQIRQTAQAPYTQPQ